MKKWPLYRLIKPAAARQESVQIGICRGAIGIAALLGYFFNSAMALATARREHRRSASIWILDNSAVLLIGDGART